MDRAMTAAASGMIAQEHHLDNATANLANSETIGFKDSEVLFADLAAGLGTRARAARTLFAQGKLVKSGGPFDLAIDGPGFFTVRTSNGTIAYTRAGDFTRMPNGTLRNGDGCELAGLRLNGDVRSAIVEPDGSVYVDTPAARHWFAGRIRLVRFSAPERLRAIGPTTFSPSAASGAPRPARADENGTIAFGMLEKSNVSIVESMMKILAAQRAYEANSKGVQAADEMLRIANNLQRN